ncbi:MAG: CoA transferase [Acidimicrobiia bacterium]|nr:CoA transferase [Acidimicrobiia bacterium]
MGEPTAHEDDGDDGPRPVVLEVGDEATAFAGTLLAELGWDVVRVESAAGDRLRRRGPTLPATPPAHRLNAGLAHLVYNAGKRSVALDFVDASAWDVVETLVAGADVVLLPLDRPPGLDAFASRLATIAEDTPTLGVVEAVFRRRPGQHSARDPVPPTEVATDLVAAAAGGLVQLCGHPDGPPEHPVGDLAWKQLSLTMAEAAIALVTSARRFGRAGWISVSAQEAVHFTTLQSANANIWHWLGTVPNRHTQLAGGTIHRSRDGRWTSFTVHPPNWEAFASWIADVLGDDSLLGPEWNDLGYIGANRHRTVDYAARLCAALDQAELMERGQASGILVLPVQDLADLATDPHLRARGFYAEVPQPALGRSVTLPRSPFDGRSPGAAPALGQHNDEVLETLPARRRPAIPITDRIDVSPATDGSDVSPGADHRQPLAGIRVLDFCWAIAGPLTTRLLADLGADVIKIESEARLDPIRYIGTQPPGGASYDTNGQFNDCNVNKRAVTIDLNTADGIDLVRRLAATADIVISNFTPDRLDRWGLGWAELSADRADLVMANLAVMGVRGPRKDWRSYGSGIVAMCGLSALTGFPGRPPICLGTLHTDFTVPYFAAAQIMNALLERERTGRGAFLEVAQYETAVRLLDTELAQFLNDPAAEPCPRRGNRSIHLAPHGVFPAAGTDRWLALACRDDAEWQRLGATIGVRGLDRWRDQDAAEAAISAWSARRDAWEAAAELQRVGVPASPVEDLAELLGRDEAMAAAHRRLEIGAGVTATVREEPIVWDGERLPVRPAPRWFEHTEEVLRADLGVDTERFVDLLGRGVLA